MPARRSEIARLRDVLHAPGSSYARDVDVLMELAAALYEGLVEARLSVPELTRLGKLIYARVPWDHLPHDAKLAVGLPLVRAGEAFLARVRERIESLPAVTPAAEPPTPTRIAA